jgi:hypothetical protein
MTEDMASDEEQEAEFVSQFISKDGSCASGDENVNTQNTTFFELKTFDGHKVNMPLLALEKLNTAQSETEPSSSFTQRSSTARIAE